MAQVERRPSSVAVVGADDETLDYGQLGDAVAALVARIDAHLAGRRPQRIGVAAGPSTTLVVAMLAAQFTGAAYVPLDPGAPPERLSRIIDVARLDVVVADPLAADAVRQRVHGVAVLLAGTDDPPGDRARLRELAQQLGPGDPAYVIFTSGSTGRPRGVEVDHRNLAASNEARIAWYGDSPSRFLLTSSIGFDSSIVGLFWPLVTGGTIVLAGDTHDVDALAATVRDRRVTHVLMVPSLYRALLDRAPDPVPDLRVAIVAGESCPPTLVNLHTRLRPGVELVNEYGPTEATVWATAHRLVSGHATVPIGAPIPGATVRIVGPDGAAVPDNVAGELWISGPGVATGYLDDDEATNERFVHVDGCRWYRTGRPCPGRR